jgi:hypothetical protein
MSRDCVQVHSGVYFNIFIVTGTFLRGQAAVNHVYELELVWVKKTKVHK